MKYSICSFLLLLLLSCSSKINEEKKTVKDSAIPVKVMSVDSSSGKMGITASGLITTENEARLAFKIGGVIEELSVEEGQLVRKGQLLATLDRTEIAAQVQQAQLAVEKAARDHQRAHNLYKDSVVTLQQYQDSKTGLDMARQSLQQAVFNRQYATIHAPADGFIVKKIQNRGEVAGPGAPILTMSMQGVGSRWVLRAGVADREWAMIEKGNKAVVTTDAFPGKSFHAVVSKKALAVDPMSAAFDIELRVDFNGIQPAVGMFGKAVITPSYTTKGVSIPYEALLEADGNNGFVFVTEDRKTVKRVDVTISSIEKDRVLISSGLAGDQWVVISGSPYLTNGANITIVN